MTPSVFNPCFIRGVISNSLAESTLRAALTPALSHGNRENRTALCGESNAPGRAGASAINRRAHRVLLEIELPGAAECGSILLMRSFQLFLIALALGVVASAVYAQQPALAIDRKAGPARIWLNGVIGGDYSLQGATNDMSAGSWDFLATLTLTNTTQSWFDSASVSLPHRFYRALGLDPTPPVTATDFRLIDQMGRSRQLFYYDGDTNFLAFVLIFVGNGCATVPQFVPTVKALTTQFTPRGIQFWLIDSNGADGRSNIIAEAAALGISNGPPIFCDAAQLVARSYQATTTPEAIAISTADWSIFYRGAIDDRLGNNTVATTQHYLADALSNFLAGNTITPSRTRPAGCAITLRPAYTNLSYSADIAPLLQAKCVRCHNPGNVASWAMTNYDIVAAFALPTRYQVMTGRMPPWHADNFFGAYANDPSMTADEAAKLIQWIDEGAPRGGGPDPLAIEPPPPTNYPYAWPAALGTPTAVLSIPVQSIPATGVVNYRYIVASNTLPSDAWLRAAVVRPGNTKVVHHCLVYFGADSTFLGAEGFFAGYVPGYDATTFPTNTGKFLPKGQALTFQIHYITIGTAATDQTQIALYTMPAPPVYPLQTKSALNLGFVLGQISIPPGASDVPISAQYPLSGTLATNILLYEMSPHMHLRGSRFKYEAIYPAGHVPASEVLLSVPKYEFQWQSLYRLAQPKYLPKGTYIYCTGAWDNSAQNRDNPDPTATVKWGDQTFNEMFIGFLNYAEVP